MKIEIYRNLHKKCYSVRDSKRKIVIDHVKEIFLENVYFRVGQKGRERVIREKRKNVHAYVLGEKCSLNPPQCIHKVSYNPYKNTTFILEMDQSPIHFAKYTVLNSLGVFISLD